MFQLFPACPQLGLSTNSLIMQAFVVPCPWFDILYSVRLRKCLYVTRYYTVKVSQGQGGGAQWQNPIAIVSERVATEIRPLDTGLAGLPVFYP